LDSLGREGLMNRALPKLDLIHQPPELLLFSDFVVVLALSHLHALSMVTPALGSASVRSLSLRL
jgi:putative spermidine/putrescine transport system permease protein